MISKSPRVRAFRRIPAWLALALLASACSVLPKSEALQVYRLPTALGERQESAAAVGWTLRLETPKSNYATSGVRIMVVPEDDNEINVYKGVRWSDPMPDLLRGHLLEAFRTDGRVKGISSEETSLYADYILGGNLTAFQTEYHDGAPQVVIRFDAYLADAFSRRLVTGRRFSVIRPLSSSAIEDAVKGFGQAADELSRSVVEWTVTEAGLQQR